MPAVRAEGLEHDAAVAADAEVADAAQRRGREPTRPGAGHLSAAGRHTARSCARAATGRVGYVAEGQVTDPDDEGERHEP